MTTLIKLSSFESFKHDLFLLMNSLGGGDKNLYISYILSKLNNISDRNILRWYMKEFNYYWFITKDINHLLRYVILVGIFPKHTHEKQFLNFNSAHRNKVCQILLKNTNLFKMRDSLESNQTQTNIIFTRT